VASDDPAVIPTLEPKVEALDPAAMRISPADDVTLSPLATRTVPEEELVETPLEMSTSPVARGNDAVPNCAPEMPRMIADPPLLFGNCLLFTSR
jgi:hypothetical protein